MLCFIIFLIFLFIVCLARYIVNFIQFNLRPMKTHKHLVLRHILVGLCCMLVTLNSFSQKGILLNTKEATDGFTLFTNFNATYLINNCGEIVNEWPVFFVDNHSKLLPNGNLLYMRNNTIFEMDWDGNIVKNLLVVDNGVRLDYEVVKMPNGNYLCAGRVSMSMIDFREYGLILQNVQYSEYDVVVEVDGTTGQIVWQWDIIDHIIQDALSDKKAYGKIKDFPRKLDINALYTFDWNFRESFMINGMDYNPELDLIAISVRKLGEVVFIDHSTTTEEAKTSQGGKYGHGGDAVYRFGNPANYDAGREVDRVLYFQHNPNWIYHGEYKGSLMIFNNLLSTNLPYSSVEIVTPEVDSDGNFVLGPLGNFQPIMSNKRYNSDVSSSFFWSQYTSGGKVMPSGNILVTTGQEGRIREFNEAGNLVWDYGIPNESYIFRTVKYGREYPAFQNRDLKGDGVVEFPPSSYDCSLGSTNTGDINVFEEVSLRQDNNGINVSGLQAEANYVLYSANGALIGQGVIGHDTNIETARLVSGLYFVTLESDNRYATFKVAITN